MRRRDFIAALGGVSALWPLAVQAQQLPVHVIGFLSSASLDGAWASFVDGFRRGLIETGFIEGQNLVIEYRWAEGQYSRLSGLAADLVSRQVSAILAAGGSDPARAARMANAAVPIVFVSAADPVETGLVTSLNRPGGNITGISLIGAALEPKRLELLHELAPKASTIAALINPSYPRAKSQSQELEEAAARLGVNLIIFETGTAAEIDAAFEAIVQQGAAALVVTQDPFLNSRRQQIIALAARHSVAAIYSQKESVAEGGLISYGPHFVDGFRQGGIYVGKILKGVKPTELPVVQPVKFELIINLKTAKTLGLTVPLIMQMTADEAIE
jgi:putative tryptophan/tyrosine transport system substrate-binding protein